MPPLEDIEGPAFDESAETPLLRLRETDDFSETIKPKQEIGSGDDLDNTLKVGAPRQKSLPKRANVETIVSTGAARQDKTKGLAFSRTASRSHIQGSGTDSSPSKGERTLARVGSNARRTRQTTDWNSTLLKNSTDLSFLAQPLVKPGRMGRDDETDAIRALALHRIVKLFKAGKCSPNEWAGPGIPLHRAVQARNLGFANALLQANANPLATTSTGVTALHQAAFGGQQEMCLLLIDNHADPNCVDQHFQTPLFFAGNFAVCCYLADRLADLNHLNRLGQSALHLAAISGIQNVLEWFYKRVSPAMRELHDSKGKTAFDYAINRGMRPDVIRSWCPQYRPPLKSKASNLAVVNKCVHSGADDNADQNDNNSVRNSDANTTTYDHEESVSSFAARRTSSLSMRPSF